MHRTKLIWRDFDCPIDCNRVFDLNASKWSVAAAALGKFKITLPQVAVRKWVAVCGASCRFRTAVGHEREQCAQNGQSHLPVVGAGVP